MIIEYCIRHLVPIIYGFTQYCLSKHHLLGDPQCGLCNAIYNIPVEKEKLSRPITQNGIYNTPFGILMCFKLKVSLLTRINCTYLGSAKACRGTFQPCNLQKHYRRFCVTFHTCRNICHDWYSKTGTSVAWQTGKNIRTYISPHLCTNNNSGRWALIYILTLALLTINWMQLFIIPVMNI